MNRLLLYAGPGAPAVSRAQELAAPLTELGFIGGVCIGGSLDFCTGPSFTNLVTFLGCSPDIALSPEDGDQYCFIRLHDLTDDYRFYHGSNTAAPHCPDCRMSRDDWQDCAQQQYCDQCELADRAAKLRWRRRGALSRLVIEVMNIYPHEAVPASQLLTFLGDVTGVEWGYAYLQE